MKVVSEKNVIRNNHFYNFIKFTMLQQNNDTYFKAKCRIRFEFIPAKSVFWILKVYTNYKLPVFRANFFKIKILEIAKQLLSNF